MSMLFRVTTITGNAARDIIPLIHAGKEFILQEGKSRGTKAVEVYIETETDEDIARE